MSVRYAKRLRLWNRQRLVLSRTRNTTNAAEPREDKASSRERNLTILKAHDQIFLGTLQSHAEQLVIKTHELRGIISASQTRQRYIPKIPPYHHEERLQNVQLSVQKEADELVVRLEHIADHALDLQKEPYPEHTTKKDEREKLFGNLTDEQKEEERVNMNYEEEVSRKRMGDRIRRYKETGEEEAWKAGVPVNARKTAIRVTHDHDGLEDRMADVDAEVDMPTEDRVRDGKMASSTRGSLPASKSSGVKTKGGSRSSGEDSSADAEVRKAMSGGSKTDGSTGTKPISIADLQRQLDLQ